MIYVYQHILNRCIYRILERPTVDLGTDNRNISCWHPPFAIAVISYDDLDPLPTVTCLFRLFSRLNFSKQKKSTSNFRSLFGKSQTTNVRLTKSADDRNNFVWKVGRVSPRRLTTARSRATLRTDSCYLYHIIY